MSRLFILLVLLVSACAPTGPGVPPQQPVRANPAGVALDGYSPVAYFTLGEATQGDAAFASEHQGVTYWLRNAEEQGQFDADPGRYVPSHGGWCTLMMGGSGRRTPGDPENFAIVDDQLLLFWSGDTPETRGMGLANWASKTDSDAKKQSAYAQRADRQWQQFVAGERHAQIMLFKERDARSITPEQLSTAKSNYVE